MRHKKHKPQRKHVTNRAGLKAITNGFSLQHDADDIAKKIKPGFKLHPSAIKTLETASELYLIEFFQEANHCANHAKRITVIPRDIWLTRRLKGQRF